MTKRDVIKMKIVRVLCNVKIVVAVCLFKIAMQKNNILIFWVVVLSDCLRVNLPPKGSIFQCKARIIFIENNKIFWQLKFKIKFFVVIAFYVKYRT